MPEQLPAEIQALVDRADAFARDTLLRLEASHAERLEASGTARGEIVNASKAAGLYTLAQPAAFGGQEAGPLALVAIRDTLAGHNPQRLADVFGPGPGVLAEVDEPLRSSHLLPLMAGQRRGGFAITEPRDALAYTRAVRDGDALVVTGRKSYVTGGTEVDFVNVVADIEDQGRAIVVVDVPADGVVQERSFQTLDGSVHAAFRFDAVRVPAEHLVGSPGQGMSRALRQIGSTRLLMAAEAVGRCRWVVEFLNRHLQRAEAAGPARESVRLRYGESRIRVYGARSAVYRAARRAESGENSINEEIAAKVLATEALDQVIDEAIQLVGGGALNVDHPLAVLYRQARVLRVAEGLTDVLAQGVARGALELGKGTL